MQRMIIFASVLIGVTSVCFSQDVSAPQLDSNKEAKDGDESAIRSNVQSYLDAFNKSDAKALSSHWTEDGDYILPSGEKLAGRTELEAFFGEYFKSTERSKLEVEITTIEFISPNVAVETGVARVIVPEEAPSETTYEAIHVKSNSGWKIDSIREWEAVERVSHYDKLQDLEWMIGRWVDADEASSVDTTCRWTTNRNFLVRSFKVKTEDEVDFEGTQVIGWDAQRDTVRSWTFDSDGGFGAGRWSRSGTQWTVNSLYVLPDGRHASSTDVYEVLDENTARFRSIARQVDGELLPSVKPVTIVRAANN